jgi:hypothetical protein
MFMQHRKQEISSVPAAAKRKKLLWDDDDSRLRVPRS